MSNTSNEAVAFEVEINNVSKPIPERLKKKMNCQVREISLEDIDGKQKQAEQRRKELRSARAERIRQREEDCARMTKTVESLLDPASRCKMSQQEARKTLRALSSDIRTMGQQLKSHVKVSSEHS